MQEQLSRMLDETTPNMLSVLLILTTVMLTVTAQENLTPYGNATQGPMFGSNGKPDNAVKPPISNEYNLSICTKSWTDRSNVPAWWMFEFSYGIAYITDITIYYRENFAFRMSGFKLYVTNTSTIPPNGYLCYADPYPPSFPSITQTISCNQLGKYAVYYDNLGADEGSVITEPIVELCYVAINGCIKGAWGTNCKDECPFKCLNQNCYPGNGSCVWGCDPQNCLNNTCDKHTAACSEGCETGWIGQFCNRSKSCLNICIFFIKQLCGITTIIFSDMRTIKHIQLLGFIFSMVYVIKQRKFVLLNK
ncbi:uncharacterized protein LOC127718329 [Mytilus californianus]|uniref:uncharacterized protein LOC127718329 n=1 Tax=Mytilus californianus TaxID=6549 RepID=UPI002246D50C|nr:uncharacterized protein LOC127718329 [Mytilus californianus]